MAGGGRVWSLTSRLNSTIALSLAGGATYTGTTESVGNFSSVHCRIFSTQDSAAGGLDLEGSADGITFRSITPGNHVLEANILHKLNRLIAFPFFRIVYTNNSTTTATFSCTTTYHTSRGALNPERADEVVYPSDDTLSVRVTSDPDTMVNRGLMASEFTVQKFGFNDDIASGTFETVWRHGGLVDFPVTAETIQVKAGGNAADTAAGAGAREVTVEGLDENFELATETIATAGALVSAVTTTTFTRVNRAYVSKVGTYGVGNTADIFIENTTSTQVLAFIEADEGITHQAFYTVPAGYTGFVRSVRFSCDSNKFSNILLCIRENADVFTGDMGSFNIRQRWGSVRGEYDANFSSYIVVPEKSDIEFQASGAGDITQVNVSFDLLVIKDT